MLTLILNYIDTCKPDEDALDLLPVTINFRFFTIICNTCTFVLILIYERNICKQTKRTKGLDLIKTFNSDDNSVKGVGVEDEFRQIKVLEKPEYQKELMNLN